MLLESSVALSPCSSSEVSAGESLFAGEADFDSSGDAVSIPAGTLCDVFVAAALFSTGVAGVIFAEALSLTLLSGVPVVTSVSGSAGRRFSVSSFAFASAVSSAFSPAFASAFVTAVRSSLFGFSPRSLSTSLN